jgi:hypothetical protein
MIGKALLNDGAAAPRRRRFSFGAVADYGAVNLGDDVTAFSSTPASHPFTRAPNSLTSLRARGG